MKQWRIEFPNKKALNDLYWIDIKTKTDRYEVKMLYIKTRGKMRRLYKLSKKKWNEYGFVIYIKTFIFIEMADLTELFKISDMSKLNSELAWLV